jgi:hypothetical protein
MDKPLVHHMHPILRNCDRINFVGPWRLRFGGPVNFWRWQRDCRLSNGKVITVIGPNVYYPTEPFRRGLDDV